MLFKVKKIPIHCITGHDNNFEFLEISELTWARAILNVILPFPCSFHHDNLKFSQNFDSLNIIQNSELSFLPYNQK